MTPLRQRMLDALVLRGMAEPYPEAYIDAVARLARHYKRSPDTLHAEEVQRYLLHLLRERQLSRSSVNQYGCAYRFLYGTVLGLDGHAFQIPLAPAPQQLPEILSRDELARLFAAARHAKARTFLMVAYGTGCACRSFATCARSTSTAMPTGCASASSRARAARTATSPLARDVLQLLRTWWRLGRPSGLAVRRRARSAATAGPDSRPALVPRVLRARRHHQARRHPRAAPRLRHPSAGGRRRPVQPAAMARPQPCQHHHALPAPGATGRARRRPASAAGAC